MLFTCSVRLNLQIDMKVSKVVDECYEVRLVAPDSEQDI